MYRIRYVTSVKNGAFLRPHFNGCERMSGINLSYISHPLLLYVNQIPYKLVLFYHHYASLSNLLFHISFKNPQCSVTDIHTASATELCLSLIRFSINSGAADRSRFGKQAGQAKCTLQLLQRILVSCHYDCLIMERQSVEQSQPDTTPNVL